MEAVDQGFPERRNGQTALIVRVIDVDDTSPNFQQSFYDVSISEGLFQAVVDYAGMLLGKYLQAYLSTPL